MKKFKVFGKSVPVALVTLVLVGGLVSAGVLSYYGSVTGEVTVEEQALTLDAEENYKVNGSSPVGLEEPATVESNSEDSVVNYKWKTVESDDLDVARHAVFPVQTYDLFNDEDEVTIEDGVTVYPGIDRMKVEASFEDWFGDDYSAGNINIEFSTTEDMREAYDHIGSDAPHVAYLDESNEDYDWMLKDGETGKHYYEDSEALVDAYPFIIDAGTNEDEETVTVVFSGGELDEQSFAVQATAGGEAESRTTENWENDWFEDSDHEEVDYTDAIGQEAVIGAGHSNHYVVSGYIYPDADINSYDFEVGVEPDVER